MGGFFFMLDESLNIAYLQLNNVTEKDTAMKYQIWKLLPVRARKGELSHKGQLVVYDKGVEDDAAGYVSDIIKDEEYGVVLCAAVDGKFVVVNDEKFATTRAALSS